MPLYELFCLARPALKKPELHEIIKRSCLTVLRGDGVVTDVTVNGLVPLAYTIKKVHGHYDQAFVWQVKFHSGPVILSDVDHDLRTDERVLRYLVTKADESTKMKQWRIFQQYADGPAANLIADDDMQRKAFELQQQASASAAAPL